MAGLENDVFFAEFGDYFWEENGILVFSDDLLFDDWKVVVEMDFIFRVFLLFWTGVFVVDDAFLRAVVEVEFIN